MVVEWPVEAPKWVSQVIDCEGIARLLGVGATHVRRWIVCQTGFPPPRFKTGQGRLWDRAEVEHWRANRRDASTF
jgi:predicted DNA-binding transcriptional regulator AlpA